LGEIVPAPGYSEERLYLYHAVLNAEAGEMCPDEDEDLEVVILSRAELDESIRSGEIIDAKTIAVWHRFLSREGGCS